MISTIPFEYPSRLLADIATGQVVRYGTILKDAATGRIVSHMQETGVVQSILSNLVTGPFIPTCIQ
jgi:hypothetical protein